jgi:selenocysteine lyase/cysteine desulfurase
MQRILDRVNELVGYAEREWVERGHRVTSPTTNDERSGVFVLELPESTDGWAMYDALRLHEATYTSPVDGPRDLRVAIHFFNTREEIDATFDTIERLA